MIELMQGWDEVGQQFFCWGCVAAVVAVAWIVCVNVRLILRGYPPGENSIADMDRMECEHDDNLTGVCVKRNGNCATREECKEEIANRSSGGAT